MVPVIGCLGGTIITTRPFSMREVKRWTERGHRVPLDLVPAEYWKISVPGYGELQRFGEEMLGSDF
jgi:hypothetical protein